MQSAGAINSIQAHPAQVAAASAVSEDGKAAAVAVASKPEVGFEVKAPIIGTFMKLQHPTRSLCKGWTKGEKGDVLMIIESMKLMNEIQSEFDGVVKEILVKNGDAVEYDQILMIIGE